MVDTCSIVLLNGMQPVNIFSLTLTLSPGRGRGLG